MCIDPTKVCLAVQYCQDISRRNLLTLCRFPYLKHRLQGICPSEIQASLPREHWKWSKAFRRRQTWPLVYRSFYYVFRCLPSLRLPFCFALGSPGCLNCLFWVCLNIFVSEVWILDFCFSITGSEHWTCQFPFLQPQHHVPTICQNQFLVWSLQPCIITWPAVLGDWYRCLTLVVSELASLSLCHFALFKVWSHVRLLFTPFLFHGRRTDPRIPHNDGYAAALRKSVLITMHVQRNSMLLLWFKNCFFFFNSWAHL